MTALALATGALSASGVSAKDLGTRGETFQIIERDILEMLKAKLEKFAKSGKLDALNKAFAARVEKKINRPMPVPGLAPTEQPRSWLFDPSIVSPQDYADQRGRVFARRGQRVNPLETMAGFDQVMVFINGDDPAQVAFGLAKLKAGGPDKVSLILTDGAPMELMKKHRVELFFDQEGKLTRHFGLQQMPAVIELDSKDRLKLRISEVRP